MVAGEIIIIMIITTETATEIKEGQKSLSFLPSFFPSFFFINSVQYESCLFLKMHIHNTFLTPNF
jgi:hypothetical protein